MRLLRKTLSECPVSVWAGGTTAELLLWPPEGSYAARDFLFRLSSARVELEESVFTSLPGVTRFITPLAGGFSLEHNGGKAIELAPYEIDAFSGADRTVCRGRATDFNLMLKNCRGALHTLRGGGTLALAGPAADCLFFPAGGTLRLGGAAERAERDTLLAVLTEAGETAAAAWAAPVALYAHISLISTENKQN